MSDQWWKDAHDERAMPIQGPAISPRTPMAPRRPVDRSMDPREILRMRQAREDMMREAIRKKIQYGFGIPGPDALSIPDLQAFGIMPDPQAGPPVGLHLGSLSPDERMWMLQQAYAAQQGQ